MQNRTAKTAAALPAREIPENEVHVRLFGPLELENRWGRVTESPRSSLSWLLLKYLLLDPERRVPREEVRQALWNSEADIDHDGAARVRLRRLRGALTPLHLDGTSGLVLYAGGMYYLNPCYDIITDEERFRNCMAAVRSLPPTDPDGLAAAREALELFRGPFLEQTEAPWLEVYRAACRREFAVLARSALERSAALEDDRAVPLLCKRAVLLAPEDEALHRAVIRHLMERGRELELARYIAKLSRGGRAPWLTETEG